MGRAPCCSKVGLHRGPWTAREDALLIKYIQTHGEGQWRSMPKKAGLLRCGKSCRLRWMNYLRPDIKRGNITPEEDDLIIRLHGLLGNRWSLIAGRLPGRTDNEIKNYWNTHLSKRLRSQETDLNTQNKASEPNLEKSANGHNKKRSSRSSMNKGRTKKFHQHLTDVDHKNNNAGGEMERTKVHLPKPIRVSSIISLTRNDSYGSFETNNVSSTSASSCQSQSQNHGISFDSPSENNIIVDIPWLLNNHDVNMVEENGFDQLMLMGTCADNVNLDIVHQPLDAREDNNKQFEKLYEEYLQLIKADHGHDRDYGDDEGAHQLDSFTESFLI